MKKNKKKTKGLLIALEVLAVLGLGLFVWWSQTHDSRTAPPADDDWDEIEQYYAESVSYQGTEYPVRKKLSLTVTRRQESMSMPSLLIICWQPSMRMRWTWTSSQSTSQQVQPGESRKVTPSKRTLRHLKNWTMRVRGLSGFAKKAPGGTLRS